LHVLRDFIVVYSKLTTLTNLNIYNFRITDAFDTNRTPVNI